MYNFRSEWQQEQTNHNSRPKYSKIPLHFGYRKLSHSGPPGYRLHSATPLHKQPKIVKHAERTQKNKNK